MRYITVKNLEKHQPSYKDRTMTWAKIHLAMAQGDPEFELIESEIDKWRYIAIILLEMKSQKPLPDIDRYWRSKGFDLRKRPMSLTIKMLHNFLECVTLDGKSVSPRVEESRVDKSRVEGVPLHTLKGTKAIPTLDEVVAYCTEIESPIRPEKFFNNYESSGWVKANGQKIKDWKATLRTWQDRSEPTQKKGTVNAL